MCLQTKKNIESLIFLYKVFWTRCCVTKQDEAELKEPESSSFDISTIQVIKDGSMDRSRECPLKYQSKYIISSSLIVNCFNDVNTSTSQQPNSIFLLSNFYFLFVKIVLTGEIHLFRLIYVIIKHYKVYNNI